MVRAGAVLTCRRGGPCAVGGRGRPPADRPGRRHRRPRRPRRGGDVGGGRAVRGAAPLRPVRPRPPRHTLARAPLAGAGPRRLVALGRGNPAPYAAVVRIPSAGCHVASASPERFLRRDGGQVWSSPIKGTASTPDGFLPKDRAENVMIVDLVRNDLGRVCEWGSVEVPALCAVEQHPGLVHLVSTVSGRLRPGVGWPALLDATFPPGSVTGAPKLAAVDHIRRLEPVPRGPYCGAVGWVDADRGTGELNVAIRTFWFDGGEVHFGTGGAVT